MQVDISTENAQGDLERREREREDETQTDPDETRFAGRKLRAYYVAQVHGVPLPPPLPPFHSASGDRSHMR